MVTFPEYERFDAVGLADLIRQRKIEPATVLAAAIERTDERNPGVGAVIHRMDDEARWDWSLSDKWDYHQLSQAALERGIAQTVFDLQRAFE